jgi:hypothetical protein
LLRGAADRVKRTLGEVGAQIGGHAKVFNNGRTGVEVEPGRPKEGNHIIGIHGSTMSKTHAGEVREHTIAAAFSIIKCNTSMIESKRRGDRESPCLSPRRL